MSKARALAAPSLKMDKTERYKDESKVLSPKVNSTGIVWWPAFYCHCVDWPGLVWSDMARCDRGIQMLLTTLGAFAAFSLMTVAIGTDYWLYSRAYICNATNLTTDETQMQPKKTKGDLTHSGLWRICCIEGKTLT